MQLIADLEAALAEEESYFRQHLIKEDVARLSTLQSLVASSADRDDFLVKGMGVGWTQNDMRTHQIKNAVEGFLAAFYAYETSGKTADDITTLRGAWRTFDKERMEKLIRCL